MPGTYWDELRVRLVDVQGQRLKLMDRHGIETMILSLNAPAAQSISDRRRAIEVACRANDALAEEVAHRPDRFRAFAALPLQDPEAAAEELHRCITELGFVGALVNGFSQDGEQGGGHVPLYYDLPQYRPFWAEVAELDVPFYLHPRNPLPADARIYDGHPWLLGPTWAFAQETAVHALRPMACGLFDDQPTLQIVLGHMGEGIPATQWRTDHGNAWVDVPPAYPAGRRFVDYFAENFHITTSGNVRTQSLVDAILEIGADRIMFSTDWPFGNIDHAARSEVIAETAASTLMPHSRDGSGIPSTLIESVRDSGLTGLTVVSNNMGVDGRGSGCCWRTARSPRSCRPTSARASCSPASDTGCKSVAIRSGRAFCSGAALDERQTRTACARQVMIW